MKISVLKARALWFVDLVELNPRGRSLYPDVVDALEERYEFQKIPTSASDKSVEGGFEFTQGTFEVRPDEYIEAHLTIYLDGLMADTRSSTEDSEAFLAGVLEFISKADFGLVYEPDMIRRKGYLSEVMVQTDKTFYALNPKLEGFAERLNETSAGSLSQFQPAGISFRSDQTGPYPSAPFVFERRFNAPFSEGRFFSQAPFRTEDHITLLHQFEEMLLA